MVGALALLGLLGCRGCLGLEEAPLKQGGLLYYKLTEISPTTKRASHLRVRLIEPREQGWLMRMETGHGAEPVDIEVDRALRPALPGEVLEIPTILGEPLDLGLFWLPPDGRGSGRLSLAGRVEGIVPFEQWRAWDVAGDDGSSRFYELDTGLLVGFEVERRGSRVAGVLSAVR